MKIGFYSKLAAEGIRKNKKLYLPYMLTSVLMIAIFYIIYYLMQSESISRMRGGATFQPVLGMGVFIIGFFASIFLFYTNSFLIKRRKKEFGLYNILGMDKHGISRILFWETIMVYAITIVVGSVAGVLFSKLFELGFANLINGEVSYDYSVNVAGLLGTAVLFGCIDLLIFLNGVRQVRFSNVIDLVKSANVGEKAPKANWLLGLVGLGLLGGAYYMAISITNPIEAFSYFFMAVLMVIAASYILMIAGSVIFCKILQKNKNYYYKKNHFVSVSSMIYRMKRNGAGLASICILLTMILVTISSTTCLFFGTESSLKAQYPRDIMVTTYFNSIEELNEFSQNNYIREEIEKMSAEYDTKAVNFMDYSQATSVVFMQGGEAQVFPEDSMSVDYSKLVYIHFISLDEYNKSCGTDYTLNPGEALAWRVRGKKNFESITFKETQDTFTIKEYVEPISKDAGNMVELVEDLTLVVDDLNTSLKNLEGCTKSNSDTVEYALTISRRYGFDTGLDVDSQLALKNEIYNYMHEECAKDECLVERFSVDALEEQREDFYSTFAGFLFLGLTLSAVFLLAAVLIIYYKQITEGYEDQPRFIIMQKVGMTKKDIRRSINSQMLTVFYLPLVMAAVHMAFAFPMLTKLLMLFGLADNRLFMITTSLTVLVIALIYAAVYKITSNIYFSMVSAANAE